MKRLLCLAALLAGCATSDDAGVGEQASSTAASCANPSDPAYVTGTGPTLSGAVNDGLDDTLAIKKAVCAAVCPTATPPAGCTCGTTSLPGYGSHAVCLPAGELDVTRPTTPGVFSSIPLFGIDRLAFYGQGPASVLAMHGSGTASCANPCSGDDPMHPCPFSDWYMFEIRGAPAPPALTSLRSPGHIEFRDLTMTSTGVDGFDKDSTRYIELGNQATNADDVLIKNVRMVEACGDHVYMIGGNGDDPTSGTRTLGVRIVDSTFGRAGRRAIVVKHGVKRVVIAHNTFETDGGTIDFDPSSSPTSTSEVIVTNNTFRTASASAIVLAGESSGATPAANLLVANNLMFGPAIVGGGLRNVEIRNNTIFNTLAVGAIALDRGQVERLDVSNNTIVDTASDAQYAISVISKGTTLSPDVRISGNSILQASQNPAIHVQDVQREVITDNVIAMTWPNTATRAAAGIRFQTDHFNVRSVQISGNSVTGVTGALDLGILVNLTSASCGTAIPPTACTSDAICGAGGFCHAGVCGCQPTLDNAQVDHNYVAGARTAIRVGTGTFGTTTPKHPTGFLGSFAMIANNDIDASVLTPIDISANTSPAAIPPAYVIGGNQGGPIQLVGDLSPLTNGVVAPNGSTYVVRGGTSAATPALYYRENNTWVAQ